ncbi:DNA replication/repair protein RecF [Aristophania vespae]|uniref:DNA replication and repair protein RecF n=1 Tax=Aristophania vespae TaxID=2697033 RepID=A0A6P1NA99_9PROT|nr:DNA replication/repair protein RecF [Aristophania vespae]QHI95575.1 DNA replication/repair protein RecF [Aristophania vespae]
MRLKRLTLTDFRNYERCVWEPKAPIAVLTGENGSGKTNLLEAISLLSPGRGLRNAPLNQFYRQNAPHSQTVQWGIAAQLENRGQEFSLSTGSQPRATTQLSHTKNARRVFLIDGEAKRNQSEIAAIARCVWLTPQMDRLFTETTSGRRRFFDRLVMGLYPDHASQMAAHERSVMSRNRLLTTPHPDALWLNSIEESISRHAVAATAARMSFIERMNGLSLFEKDFPCTNIIIHCEIAALLKNHPALYVEDWLREQLKTSRETDAEKASTSYGVHKSDFSLIDRATKRSAALSSSGQQKLMLLGVILHQALLVHETWGTMPFLLLDEPLVHLDKSKRGALLTTLTHLKSNVFLTGTEYENFEPIKSQAAFYTVKNGFIQSR